MKCTFSPQELANACAPRVAVQVQMYSGSLDTHGRAAERRKLLLSLLAAQHRHAEAAAIAENALQQTELTSGDRTDLLCNLADAQVRAQKKSWLLHFRASVLPFRRLGSEDWDQCTSDAKRSVKFYRLHCAALCNITSAIGRTVHGSKPRHLLFCLL
jgi:hypothetical protein